MFQFPTFPTWSYVFTSCFTVLHRECFHIRKSADRSLFAAPRSLSQLVTSFFGSWCQGIHLMLLFAWTSAGSFLPECSFELVLLNCLSFFLNKCFGFLLRSKKVLILFTFLPSGTILSYHTFGNCSFCYPNLERPILISLLKCVLFYLFVSTQLYFIRFSMNTFFSGSLP